MKNAGRITIAHWNSKRESTMPWFLTTKLTGNFGMTNFLVTL